MLAKVDVKMRKLIESRLAFLLEEKGRSGRRGCGLAKNGRSDPRCIAMGENWDERRSSIFKTTRPSRTRMRPYMERFEEQEYKRTRLKGRNGKEGQAFDFLGNG